LMKLASPLQVIGPTLQSGAHLSLIARSIIDTSNAALMSAHVIEHRLDDVRLHAKLCQLSRCCAPEIVKSPRRNPSALIKRSLGPCTTLNSFSTKYKCRGAALAPDSRQGLS